METLSGTKSTIDFRAYFLTNGTKPVSRQLGSVEVASLLQACLETTISDSEVVCNLLFDDVFKDILAAATGSIL
jgi:hypothetical protein